MGTKGIRVFRDVEADGLIVDSCNDETADNLEVHGFITVPLAESFLFDMYLALH